MQKCIFFLMAASIFIVSSAQASDPIAFKKEQFIQKQLILQKQLLLQNQMALKAKKMAQKTTQLQLKPVKVAMQIQAKSLTPTESPQQKKVDISSFAIRPMQAWKEELKVPSTSNDGIEILPHAVN